MNGPRLGVIQNEDIEDKGQGGSVPELEKGPDQGYEKQDLLRDRPGRQAGAGAGAVEPAAGLLSGRGAGAVGPAGLLAG